MSTKENGYVRRINCICYKELSQSLRVRVYISFKFVSEFSRLKSRFNHIFLGWSLNEENCGLFITILFHCFSFLDFEGHSILSGYKKWLHLYCKVVYREWS